MSIDLSFLLAMVYVATPIAVVLFVCTGVGGYRCHISSSKFCAGTPSLQFMNRAPTFTSAAEDIATLMI